MWPLLASLASLAMLMFQRAAVATRGTGAPAALSVCSQRKRSTTGSSRTLRLSPWWMGWRCSLGRHGRQARRRASRSRGTCPGTTAASRGALPAPLLEWGDAPVFGRAFNRLRVGWCVCQAPLPPTHPRPRTHTHTHTHTYTTYNARNPTLTCAGARGPFLPRPLPLLAAGRPGRRVGGRALRRRGGRGPRGPDADVLR